MLYAEIDIARVAPSRRTLDVTGHCARTDIFDLQVRRAPAVPARFVDGEGGTGALGSLVHRAASASRRWRSSASPSPRHALPCMQASVPGPSAARWASVACVCGACAK